MRGEHSLARAGELEWQASGGLPEPPTRRARRRPEPPRAQRNSPSGAVSRAGVALRTTRARRPGFLHHFERHARRTAHSALGDSLSSSGKATARRNLPQHKHPLLTPPTARRLSKVTGLISRRRPSWWPGTANSNAEQAAERQAKSVQASGRSGTPGSTTPRTPLRTPFARARTRDPLRGPSPRAPRGHFLCSTDEGRPVTTSRLGCTGRRW